METTKQGGRRLTPEEAREMGRRGGVKSGESRRRKKYLRGCMLRLLELPAAGAERRAALRGMGLCDSEMSNRMLLAASIFEKAVKNGDVSAFREICSLIGEEAAGGDGMLEELIQGLKEND